MVVDVVTANPILVASLACGQQDWKIAAAAVAAEVVVGVLELCSVPS